MTRFWLISLYNPVFGGHKISHYLSVLALWSAIDTFSDLSAQYVLSKLVLPTVSLSLWLDFLLLLFLQASYLKLLLFGIAIVFWLAGRV